MAFNHKDNFDFKRAKKMVVAAFLSLLLLLNVYEFMRLIAANPQKVVEYRAPFDAFAEFRHPVPIVLYYSLPDENVKLVIVPAQKFLQYQNRIHRILTKYITPLAQVVVEGSAYCPSLRGVFTDVRCLEDINRQTLKNLLDSENTAVILFRDISEETDTLPFLSLVKELNLRPEVLNLLNRRKSAEQVRTDDVDDKTLQAKNLQNFVIDYQETLHQIVADQTVNIKPTEQNKNLFDRASVVVLACVPETAECEEYANKPFTESVYMAVKEQVKRAREDWPRREIKIFLLTDMFAQDFASETEFAASLSFDDGVLLREGLRSGILLPYFRRFYPEKKDFIKQLKIKSGLSPDYWSDNVHIYYFRAVEIGNNGSF